MVVPHIFMHRELLPQVIFSPGQLAISLADELTRQGHDVTLFSPGPVDTVAHNATADLTYFQQELDARGDTYLSLLKKHPFTFITLARQVQSEIIADAFEQANAGEFDIVHIYTNEEDTALPFASLCNVPVVFTHHDPFNFMVKYKRNFPKYKHLNWISLSYAQRSGMPADTNWVGNVYHGIDEPALQPAARSTNDYVLYLGRIIQPKGVHLAIKAVQLYNQTASQPLTLKIAGKHYGEAGKDTYWQTHVEPALTDPKIEYIGFVSSTEEKQRLLANARALLVPSLFDEPFGVVSIEAFACGTPVIALDSGALPEVVEQGKTGYIVTKKFDNGILDETDAIRGISQSVTKISDISRSTCRATYETKFTAAQMAQNHERIYHKILKAKGQ